MESHRVLRRLRLLLRTMVIALCPVVLFLKVEPFCVPKEFLMGRLVMYIGVAILVFGCGPVLIIGLLTTSSKRIHVLLSCCFLSLFQGFYLETS